MLSISEIQLLFAGAAALFAFLSVLVGILKWRWDAADSVLERERKLKSHVVGVSVSIPYEQDEVPQKDARIIENTLDVPAGSIGGFDSMFGDPSFEFEVVDIVVTEDTGLRYGFAKLRSGLQGSATLKIVSRKKSDISTGKESLLPPDIEIVEDCEMNTEVDLEESSIILHLDNADETKINQEIEVFFDYLESKLGNVSLDWDYPASTEIS